MCVCVCVCVSVCMCVCVCVCVCRGGGSVVHHIFDKRCKEGRVGKTVLYTTYSTNGATKEKGGGIAVLHRISQTVQQRLARTVLRS